MNRTIQTNGQSLNGPESLTSTTVLRTLVERGVRPVNNAQNSPSTTISSITTITKQHEDEQRELNELNTKLSTYLDHVHNLETFNGQSLSELDEIKRKWGNETDKIHATYGPQLDSLRNGIDDSLRDQIFYELQLKQYEYNIWHTQQRIDAFDNDTANQLNAVQQELNRSIVELERIKKQFDQRSANLVQQRTNLNNLDNEFTGLQTELLNHRLERIMVENELQTLREHAAFQDATYQAQRKEILSLNVPLLDLSRFYRDELAHAISDIRQDFEALSQSQYTELEEYYRIKTEEIRGEIAEEDERKRLLASENEITDNILDASAFADLVEEYKKLKMENNQLQIDLDDTEDDLTRIQNEHIRELEKYDSEFNQLQQEIDNKQAINNGLSENAVSLRFELSTYRHLLNSEEKRLNRLEQNQQLQTSPSPSSPSSSVPSSSNLNQKVNDYSLQKMSVKKTSRGPVVFDSVDFINDCVIIMCDKTLGSKQSLENWTVRRQNDQQPEIVYRFPSSFILRPRQTIRILSKRSPQSARSGNDVVIADQIDTWGQGQVMVTRLIDANNEEKANIIQTRLAT